MSLPSRYTLAVSICNSPPSGMASRALITRLSRAFSSWLTSVLTRQMFSASCRSSSIWSPLVRLNKSSREWISSLGLSGLRLSDWRRENASKRWVRAAARLAEDTAASVNRPISLARPSAM
ncbi:hypothetical protein D9M71_380070 [compost metagenome]